MQQTEQTKTKNEQYCHAIGKQGTKVMSGLNFEPGLSKGFSTERCFLPSANAERIIINQNNNVVFDIRVEELYLQTRLYVTLCKNIVLLSWGGVDPDEEGNYFDYEVYHIQERSLIDSGSRHGLPILSPQDCLVRDFKRG